MGENNMEIKKLNKQEYNSLLLHWNKFYVHRSSGFYREFDEESHAINYLRELAEDPNDTYCKLIYATVGNRAFVAVHHYFRDSQRYNAQYYELVDGIDFLHELGLKTITGLCLAF